jgi:hypothetical protein
VAAHHAGADKANAQRLVHGRSRPIITRNQHAQVLLSIISDNSSRIGAILPPNIKY